MWKSINRELKQISQLIDTWSENGVSELDKDVVLEKLRGIYRQVKFFAPEPEQENAEIIEKQPEPAKNSAETENEVPGQSDISEVRPETHDNEEPDVPAAGQGVEEFGMEEPSVEEQPKGSHADKLFDVDELPVKAKRDRKVILSLYGDDPDASAYVISAHGNQAGTAEVPVAETGAEADATTPESSETGLIEIPEDIFDDCSAGQDEAAGRKSDAGDVSTVSDTIKPAVEAQSPDTQKVVIGDVINNNGKTIADTYAEHNHTTDVATKISTENVMGLRKAIGINDKFLMVRDVFGGDTVAFEAAVNDLERFSDLDEALIHIHDNYSWNPNNEGVKLLIDILTKKLS